MKEDSVFFELSDSEKKTRSKWRNLFIGSVIFIFLIALLLTSRETSSSTIGETMVMLIMALPILYFHYHCAYKKYGTVLLTISLICVSISEIQFIIEIISESPGFLKIILGIVRTACFLCWFILSLKLLKINKRFQSQKCSYDNFCHAILPLQKASTIEDLDSALNILIKKWPQFETSLLDEYRKKGESLMSGMTSRKKVKKVNAQT